MRPSRLTPGTPWDVFSVFADVPGMASEGQVPEGDGTEGDSGYLYQVGGRPQGDWLLPDQAGAGDETGYGIGRIDCGPPAEGPHTCGLKGNEDGYDPETWEGPYTDKELEADQPHKLCRKDWGEGSGRLPAGDTMLP